MAYGSAITAATCIFTSTTDTVALDEQFGSEARGRAERDFQTGGLLVKSERGPVVWSIPLRPAYTDDSRELLVAGTYMKLPSRTSRFEVRVGNTLVYTLRGVYPVRFKHGFATAPSVFGDVPLLPSGLQGLQIPIPSAQCRDSSCTIRISVSNGFYGVQRLAIRTLRPVSARPLLAMPAGPTALVVVGTLVLAATTMLFVRRVLVPDRR